MAKGAASQLPRPQQRHGQLMHAALVLLGIWMALCGGTLYAFSAWEVELMGRCHLSARSLDSLYSAGQFGVGLGIVPGLLYDSRGPRATCLYAFVLTLIGNLGLYAAIGVEDCGGLPVLAILYLLMQNGSVALYQAGLISNSAAAPLLMHGTIAGIVAAGYGLSAALFSEFYRLLFESNLRHYFLGTAVVFSSSALLASRTIPWMLVGAICKEEAAAALREHAEDEEGADALVEGEAKAAVVAVRDGAQSEGALVEGEDDEVADTGPEGVSRRPGGRRHPSGSTDGDGPMLVPATIGHASGAAAGNGSAEGADIAMDFDSPKSSAAKAAGQLPGSLRDTLLTGDLWLSVATFAVLQAVGSGIFIANLSLMSDSLGVPVDRRLFYVRAVSYCNCLGRVAAGCLMDMCEPRGVPRVAHTIWTATVLLLAAGALYQVSDEALPGTLFPALVAVGIAYGANWAVMASCLKARFGDAHFGVCFNLHASFLAVAVAFTSYTIGSLYDTMASEASQGGGPDGDVPVAGDAAELFCQGARCWREAFLLGCRLSTAGLLGALTRAVCAARR